MTTAALHLVVTLALCAGAVPALAGARWVWRSPRTGIVLWQMLGLTWALSVIGLLLTLGLASSDPLPVALAAWDGSGPGSVLVVAGLAVAAWLLGAVAWSWTRILRVRRRQRDVLALVGRVDRAVPGALVVDSPLPVAYCLPGARATVVLSSAAVAVLDRDELLVVLAHERAHVRERHDLVLLPFTALRRLAPRGLADRVVAAVALLVEMRADERACRAHGVPSLVSALRRFDPDLPATALGAANVEVDARLRRLTGGPTLAAPLRWLLLAGGAVLVSTPVSFVVW